jgi:hypothetical protein
MDELNPNHPALIGAHDHWHKIAALLMLKFGVNEATISPEELARFSEMDINIAIRFDDTKGIELFIVPDLEAAKIMARREGGLPV